MAVSTPGVGWLWNRKRHCQRTRTQPVRATTHLAQPCLALDVEYVHFKRRRQLKANPGAPTMTVPAGIANPRAEERRRQTADVACLPQEEEISAAAWVALVDEDGRSVLDLISAGHLTSCADRRSGRPGAAEAESCAAAALVEHVGGVPLAAALAAPPLADVARRVQQLCAGAVLIGHGVRKVSCACSHRCNPCGLQSREAAAAG
jgi:hypothetical protein